MMISREPDRTVHLVDVFQKREPPKIGGSFGGFIALVVCLILIIAASSAAIFYLLRHRDPSDAERASRRQRRYQHQSSSHFASSDTSSSWFSKLKSLFGSSNQRRDASGALTESTRMRSGQGWVQAGSGDEWDDSDDIRGQRRVTEVSGSSVAYGPPLDTPFLPPAPRLVSSDSTSSVRFDLHGVSGVPYRAVSPEPSLPTIHSRELSLRTASPEPIYKSSDSPAESEGRKFSDQSAVSTRTFSGGTKFIEGL